MATLYKRLAVVLLTIACFIGIAGTANAQRPEIFQSGQREFGANLAVGGYDTVAYHSQNAAVPGDPKFRVSWKGAEWRFSSEENRDKFVKSPDAYAPQFGGYCAFAVAYGSTAAGDPKLFTLTNGKLYLNLNQSVQSSWLRDQANLIKRGEENWPKVIQ